ncbi:hypothetical protein BVG79_00013 [Ketogulonicigenium robustum]|uniref:Uncharacterized protein n=1 Tax=Ketogulonicigenium robustum TaxID=92947 RepID=A0A1W6NVY5_9RHOB|nr:hypothetical protein [Ketogulonicigenium robustum]ARO13375.1 hypothetical protein BVG79_00013 [Ketogulonicigenium robustum]
MQTLAGSCDLGVNNAGTLPHDACKIGAVLEDASPQKNETPGALAGATEGDTNEPLNSDADYQLRRDWAIALRYAIESCDPLDAALIMSDALERMRQGRPIPPLMNALDEARNWAAWATPFEVKAYALACFEALPPKAQAGFLAHVTGRPVQ